MPAAVRRRFQQPPGGGGPSRCAVECQERERGARRTDHQAASPTNNGVSTTSGGAQRPAAADHPANSRETPGPAAADGYGGWPSGQPPVRLGQAVGTLLFGRHRSGDQRLTSDRGAQFTSSLWSAMANLLGSQLHHTTAYHPQSNGLVERFHRHLKSALMARLEGPNWVDELPWVLLGIRTAPKEDLHTSSAELVYGAPLVVPGEFIPAPKGQEEEPTAVLDRLRDRLGNLTPIPTSQHGQSPTCITVSFFLYDGADTRHRYSDPTRGRLR
ncbi:uncharacterized protein [Mobula birostris]|uniref:uncharacterized protein n=1 Tax=Mobula birostris TaxID=1983395 RepID=UPI003B28B9EF